MICLPGAEGGGGQRPSLHSVAHRSGTTARLSGIQRPVDASAESGSR
jgi:hypothetical protein